MVPILLLLLLVPQSDALDQYRRRAARLRAEDAEGHYRLGLWCEKHALAAAAKAEFRTAVMADPTHAGARVKLGHRLLQRTWVSPAVLEASRSGVRFPSEEDTKRMRARGPYHRRVLDLFWNRDNWAVALARFDERTGLFEGILSVEVRFQDLKGVPAMGRGRRGRGTIWIDVDNLARYEKAVDAFVQRLAVGGRVAVPPAKIPAILTHELVHCFQGGPQPSWFQEGLASYVAGDGHFIAAFRYHRQRVREIEEAIDPRYVYARGWGFFEFLRSTYGPTKLRGFLQRATRAGASLAAAASAVFAADWRALKEKETAWTQDWISAYR